MNFNLHPRTFGSLKCEHGDCWNVNGRPGGQCVKLCRDHGVWALCDEHAAVVSIEHARLCTLPMRYSIAEYQALVNGWAARQARYDRVTAAILAAGRITR